MIRNICKDIIFLKKKSEKATSKDLQIAKDLLETLISHSDRCVGMASNMIGENKAIIACCLKKGYVVMLNPQIVKKDGKYKIMEGCLSLSGEREAVRYNQIEVVYQDMLMKKHKETFSGFEAQIIQHEVDHLNGIII